MKDKSNIELGITGIIWMLFMTLSRYIIKIVITYFLARLLTPEDYGEMSSISVLANFAELFWLMGIGPAIVQKRNLDKDDVATGNTINIILGFSVFFIIFVFSSYLCNFFSITSEKMLIIYSLVFIIHSICGISRSLAQKKCKYGLISISDILGIIVFGTVSIVLAYSGFKVWSLIIASLAEATTIAVIFLAAEPIKLNFRIKRSSAKSLLFFGGGYTLSRLFSYVANNSDYFIVNKMLGKVQLGLYSKAYQLLMYPVTLVGESLDQVLFPLLSKNQSEIAKLNKVFISGISLILIVSMPIAVIAYFCAEPLVYFLLGEQWGEVINPFKILVVGLFFRIGYKLSDSLVRSIGKVYQRAKIQMLYAILVIIGAYIGHFNGLAGVAIGVTCAFTINYFLVTALSMHFLNIEVKQAIKKIYPCLFYVFILIIIAIIIKPVILLVNNNLLICFLTTIILFPIYMFLFIYTRKRILDKEVNDFIDQIMVFFISKIRSIRYKAAY